MSFFCFRFDFVLSFFARYTVANDSFFFLCNEFGAVFRKKVAAKVSLLGQGISAFCLKNVTK